MRSRVPVGFISIACFLLLWEVLTRLLQIEQWILPGPMAIAKELFLSRSTIQEDFLSTSGIALAGLFIGVFLGTAIASILHLVPLSKRWAYPYVVLSQNIPIIAVAPLLIMWLGFGVDSKVMIVALVCFFPITVATLDGFSRVDDALRVYLEMEGASRGSIFMHLECPSALPSFFSGLKLSGTYSVMGAVIAEWLGAGKGLGVLMTLASHSFRTDRVFVAILLIMTVSMILFHLISMMERKLIFWQREKRILR